MFIQVVVAVLLLAGVLLTTLQQGARGTPPETRAAQAEAERLGAFAYGLDRYLERHRQVSGRLTWADLRTEEFLPSGLRGATLPAHWYAVVDNNEYVICAPLSPATLAMIARRMPEGYQGERVDRGDTSYLVFSPADGAEQEAQKCVI